MALKTVHYASLTVNDEDVYGTAELLNGSGYNPRHDFLDIYGGLSRPYLEGVGPS